eukprot:1220-Heterococcus_DN1.PRE.3
MEMLDCVADSLAVARRNKGDVDVILFVKLQEGHVLDENTVTLIKRTIRQKLTPRHEPAEVIAVADIPYTRSGKKVEVAVTRAIHGEQVGRNVSRFVQYRDL